MLVTDQLLPGAGPVPASPANNGYKPGFAAALMLKDLKLAREAAESVKVNTALGAQAAEIYEDFAARRPQRRGFLRHHQFRRASALSAVTHRTCHARRRRA